MKLVLMKCDWCDNITEWAIDNGSTHDHCPNCGSIDGEEYDEEDEREAAEEYQADIKREDERLGD